MTRVNRSYFLTIFFFFIAYSVTAQIDSTVKPKDSIVHPRRVLLQKKDTIVLSKDSLDLQDSATKPDSIIRNPRIDTGWHLNQSLSPTVPNLSQQVNARHPYFGFASRQIEVQSDIREFQGKELLFYLMVLLLIIYAFLRLNFPKYFNDLFSLFFRTTLKQLQTREQLIQTPLPSLLLNGYFVLCGGLYVAFVLQHYKLNPLDNFWLMALYAGLGLASIYFIKFLGLKLTGWVFDMPEAANAYIFIVFVTNKMLGLFLLPFLILLAFTQGTLYPISLTLSFCVVGALLIYRFILSYAAVRNQVKVNPFHFFLYLIAFEIAPLLLIYKGLLLFFRITA